MTPHLIGLSGRARVGKDTAAQYLTNAYGYTQYAFAKPIKDMLQAAGFERGYYNDETNPQSKEDVIPALGCSYRKLAQTLGTEWGRSIHPEFWLLLAQRFVGEIPKECGVVVSDLRFENEAEWIRAEGGLVIHIDGPARGALQGSQGKHTSEAGVERLQGDIVIANTAGKSFLHMQLDAAIRSTH